MASGAGALYATSMIVIGQFARAEARRGAVDVRLAGRHYAEFDPQSG